MSLLTEIEQAVNRGLNFCYSKDLPFASFTEEIRISEAFDSLPFSLPYPQMDAFVLQRRMPQTRVYVSEFYSADVHLRLVSFFETHWLLLYPLSAGSPRLQILPAAGYEFKTGLTDGEWKGNTARVSLSGARCVQIGKSGTEPPDLSLLIQQERERHPLRVLQLSDSQTVQKTDRLWAQLPWVDEQGKPYTEKLKTKPEAAVWLNVLYSHLGWDEAEYNQSAVKGRANGFLEKYLTNNYKLSEIRDFWETVHFPAYALKLKQEIRQNPSEYIAFALLAIKERFVWQEIFISSLLCALPPFLRGLIELLVLLKRQTPLFVNGQKVEFSANGSEAVKQSIRQPNQRLTAGTLRHHKRNWTALTIDPFFAFKIDQQATLKWQGESKRLQIVPLLWRPPVTEPAFYYAELEMKGVRFHIPLAWRQFEVQIHTLRIKFLRKKKRFQLSVRLGKKDELYVNGQLLSARDTRYHTVYQTIPPYTEKTQTGRLVWLNGFGGSRYLAHGMYLRGWLLDRKHILHESVQVSKEGQRHSVQVHTNSMAIHTSKIWREQLIYRVNGRYCETQKTELKVSAGIMSKFLYTPAEQLPGRLMIFSDENPVAIRSVFRDTLGIVPECLPLDRFAQYPERITIIIAYEFAGETVNNKQSVTILRNIPGIKRDVLAIHPSGLNDLFNTVFKNK